MLQNFHRRTTPDTAAARLAALRAAMAEAGVDAFLVPRADAHQGENVAPRDDRLAWLTGFTGSAGFAVVTRDAAAIFVDGRYRLQVRAETDPAVVAWASLPDDKAEDWLVAALPGGGRVGFDPWLHGAAEIETLTAALGPRQLALVRAPNLVDRVWVDQPPPPAAPLAIQPDALAGRSAAEKRAEIGRALAGGGLAAAVLTLPDSIAWLLNVRGGDVARTPAPLAFAVIASDGRVDLLLDPAKVGPEVAAHLGPDVRIRPEAEFGAVLDGLAGRVALDRTTAPLWVSDRLAAAGRAEIVWTPDPCVLPKATKTEAEIAGARAAHRRDGAAMASFLAWLDATAPGGGLTEIDVVRRLEDIRRETGALRDISFDTICGAGPDGAIVHYRVSEATNRPVRPGELLLVDSGAQYQDGTTDITRTVAIGDPPPGAAVAFTLVLKGLIAMSRLRWPPGLAGRDIDAIARAPLWAAGLDYDHGTGHGVGSYLGVHEGPAGLSRRSAEPIRPGMILSIEPGFYREGAFGIRIENLAVVRPPETPEGGERPMLGWETLTLAPIDRRLIDPSRLDAAERAWLDAYHARVASELTPLLPAATAAWLRTACAPL
ncbi:aminopeptidase P family protein [Amaricoccus sp.]|uniref:aminopeptidase P family protein n=1 Tax=Amaricoccus sp. TaxID=1872485 RepID=UPI001B666796|nr:aminopeptidase P family protein [Amaricoccus sp.]MBP7241486.1 aminopeptidase P family protein [Amaricoccus sp.]